MINSQCLNSYWKFIKDEKDEGIEKKWFENMPDGTENIWVPSCWNGLREDMLHYEGIGWYYKEIVINEIRDVTRNVLFFHGVNYKCEIWINGKHAGSHEGGFTPFEIEITKHILFDSKNIISIRVDSRMDKWTVPPAGVDWFNYGGIFRDVYLNGTGESFIEDVFINTKIDGNVKISVDLGNYNPENQYVLEINILDKEEMNQVFKADATIFAKSGIFEARIVNPKLWSPNSAFMYDFTLVLKVNDIITDVWEHKIGVRELTIKDRKILLNGSPILLRGYSKHEEYPMHGRTFSYDIVRKDYEICKQGNTNFIRMCHYPHHLKEYEIASQTGFLVMAEVPNVNFLKEHFQNEEFIKRSINQLKEMLKYYKNETCIAFWGLFIECKNNDQEVVDVVAEYIKLVKETDCTRFTVHASLWPTEDMTYELFDIIGINYWRGWYNGESIENGGELLDEIASKYPDKPVVMTSGGWEGIPNFHSYKSGVKWSEEVQAEYLDELTKMYLTKEYISGEIIWTFNDFRVNPWYDPEKDWFRGWWALRPMEMNFKGVVDYYRRPKLAYYKLQETFKRWDDRG